jgi:ABC-type uncharacterized transport system substrate-binding protein
MKRREFIAGVGSAAAWPMVTRGQQALPMVGYVGIGEPESYGTDRIGALRKGLSETGYVDGTRVIIESRSAQGQFEHLASVATELIERGAKVITGPSLVAKASTTIPMVLRRRGDMAACRWRTAASAPTSCRYPGSNSKGLAGAQERYTAFLEAFEQLGWTDGRDVQIVVRWSGGNQAETRKYAEEMVALAPDVLIAGGSTSLEMLLKATRTIPIVFVTVPDPVGSGFVEHLSRPGGSMTRAALVANPKGFAYDYFVRSS